MGTADCIDILIAFFLPPLGVFLKFGCGVRNCVSQIIPPVFLQGASEVIDSTALLYYT
jgi:uncharacterized membrane protein YqaE (UPF0057 family)